MSLLLLQKNFYLFEETVLLSDMLLVGFLANSLLDISKAPRVA
jgi:hypothetical protein